MILYGFGGYIYMKAKTFFYQIAIAKFDSYIFSHRYVRKVMRRKEEQIEHCHCGSGEKIIPESTDGASAEAVM